MKRRLLIITLMSGLLFGMVASLIHPGAAYASTANNALLLVGEHCHDLLDLEHSFSSIQTPPPLYSNNDYANQCHSKNPNIGGWDALLVDSLGCSAQLFYTHDFQTDPTDSSVVTSKWYTHEDAYKYCYTQATAQYDLLASPTCARVKNGSDNWNKCQDAQNKLWGALGCESKMFQDLKDGQDHWAIKPAALSNCQQQVAAVGNVQIVILGSDGKFAPDPNPISSSSVAAVAPGGGGPTSSVSESCSLTGGSLSWIMCPVIDGIQLAVTWLDDQLTSWMVIGTNGNTGTDQPQQIFCPGAETGSCGHFYKAWISFRDLALGLMVIAGLIMVVSQALGMEILDAYTIRKVLPRVLIAAVTITLSWPLMEFLVTLSNDLGYGIRSLILDPFGSLAINFSFGALWGLVAVGGLAIIGILGLLSFAATALIAVLVAFLTLAVRQLVVIILVLISPIAIVAYILPGTQKYYKQWQELFIKTLLMFPLIVAFLAGGRVLAAVASQGGGYANTLIALVAYIGPYFAIPMTFRMSGGIMNAVGSAVNSRGEGARNALRGFRSNRAKKNLADLASGERLNTDINLGNKRLSNFYNKRVAGGFNKATAGTANLANAGFNPLQMRNRMAAARAEQNMERAMRSLNEDEVVKHALMDDDIAESLLSGRESYAGSGHYGGNTDTARRQFLKDRGYTGQMLEEKVATGRAASRRLSDHTRELTAWLANTTTGTGFAEKEVVDADGVKHKTAGGGEAIASLNKIVGGDDQTRVRAIAAMRERATQAGRMDLAGMSFTEQVGMARKAATGGLTPDQVSEQMRKGAIFGQSRGSLIGRRPQTTKAIVPQLQANFDQLLEEGNTQGVMEELAMAAAGQQVAGQVSKENASEHAKYMNHKILSISEGEIDAVRAGHLSEEDLLDAKMDHVKDPGVKESIMRTAKMKVAATGKPLSNLTVQDMLDANRGNRELTAMTYQYGNDFAAAAAQAARGAAGTIGSSGSTPPGAAPTSPPTGPPGVT
jgi:hypothetical protein